MPAAVMLLVYYLKRLIVLYIRHFCPPLVALLWLLPSFKDFAVSSAKMYITTIFGLVRTGGYPDARCLLVL